MIALLAVGTLRLLCQTLPLMHLTQQVLCYTGYASVVFSFGISGILFVQLLVRLSLMPGTKDIGSFLGLVEECLGRGTS